MKLNNKQKTIMRVVGAILFAIALILILNLVFNNKVKIDKKYIGKWMIGYKFYTSEDSKELVYTYEQELYLKKDGTFYTINKTIPDNGNENSVHGTYEASNDKLILKFEQKNLEKNNILILKEDKLCTDVKCNTYYTKDKIDNYFNRYNSTVITSEK